MLIRSPKALGALIRNRRSELGIDQAELASRAGTTRHWIMDVEKGKPTVELVRVLRTLEALELEIEVRPRSNRSEPVARSAEVSVPRVDIDSIVNKARRGR